MMESILVFRSSLSFFKPNVKLLNLLVVSHSYRTRLVLANHIERFQLKYISRTKWWNSLYFFTCWCQKLRVDRKTLRWLRSEMVVAHWSQSLDEWMDGLRWFFAYWCKFEKVKNYFKNFWVTVVKNVHGTLISKCMNELG